MSAFGQPWEPPKPQKWRNTVADFDRFTTVATDLGFDLHDDQVSSKLFKRYEGSSMLLWSIPIWESLLRMRAMWLLTVERGEFSACLPMAA